MNQQRLSLLFAVAALVAAPCGGAEPGWVHLEIPATDSYCDRYIPASVDQTRSAPTVVFLHGSGAYPHQYHRYLEDAAETAGCVVILPKSQRLEGWGHGSDVETIEQSLQIVGQELRTDVQRTAVAGHSSGGAYACRLAFTTVGKYSAVFTMAAPFLYIGLVFDTTYTAPVHMYWGFDDPNFQYGAWESYDAQWERLDVPWEFEVLLDYGHNDLPESAVENGFMFLVEQQRPFPPRPVRRGGRRVKAP